jgi:hypothetical protein
LHAKKKGKDDDISRVDRSNLFTLWRISPELSFSSRDVLKLNKTRRTDKVVLID